MKYYRNSKTVRNNWYLHPMVGITRTKSVKNEFGVEELVPVEGIDNRDIIGMFLPSSPFDFLPYIKIRSMISGNFSTTAKLVEKCLLLIGIQTKKKNTYVSFEEGLRHSLPVLGVRLISKNISSKKYDVAAIKENQATSLISKWVLETLRTNNSQNISSKSSYVLGSEIVALLNADSANSILLKKRNAFYTELWNLYNLKDENI